MKLGPARVRKRPVAFVAKDEFLAGVADIELYERLLVPAVALALQEIAEELLLQRNPIIRVVVRPVLDAVHLQPFLLGGGAEEALEIAARVQRLPAPVCGGE